MQSSPPVSHTGSELQDIVAIVTLVFIAVQTTALVASLVYLAREFRMTLLATRANAFNTVIGAFASLEARISQDEESARIYNAGVHATRNLADDEFRRFSEMMATTFNIYETMHYQFRRGFLDPTLWAGWCRYMREQLTWPGVADWWKNKRQLYNKTFVDYVDSGKCPDP